MKRHPSRRLRILVTGFDVFGRERFNPSEWAVRQLKDDEIRGVELVRVVLPTSYRRAELGMRELLRKVRPDAVVSFGLAAKRSSFVIETVALNVDHAEERDNDGKRRLRRKIDPRGQELLETRLPVDVLLRTMKRARIPCDVSYHAGTYVCNHLFYVLLRGLRNRPGIPAGFVHLPPVKRVLGRGLSEKKLLSGVRTILTGVAKECRI